MSLWQIVSVLFLLIMLVLIVRGIRGHPRRIEAVELDATGREVGRGMVRMSEHLDTNGTGSSEGAAGGD